MDESEEPISRGLFRATSTRQYFQGMAMRQPAKPESTGTPRGCELRFPSSSNEASSVQTVKVSAQSVKPTHMSTPLLAFETTAPTRAVRLMKEVSVDH